MTFAVIVWYIEMLYKREGFFRYLNKLGGQVMIKVLIVEDNSELRFLIEEIVRSVVLNVEISLASDGLEGLEALKDKGPFDLLITDIKMPVMDGITMIGEARRLGIVPSNIFIVSSEERPDENFLTAIGVSHFFQKPNFFDEMTEAIKKIFK